MPVPEFTNDEQYLIDWVKSPESSANSAAFMWGYIIGGIAIAGFAVYHGSIVMMFAAFAIVCGFRAYEEHYQNKWLPLWRSIIAKYESAATQLDVDVVRDS